MSEIAAPQAAPDPATNPWVPLWNLAPTIALDYLGAWAAGTYVDGNVVIDNGVAYMCVRQTTKRPSPWAPVSLGGPGAELAYAEFTGSQITVTATTEATAQTIATAPAITLDGASKIMLEGFTCAQPPPTVGQFLYLTLFDGASVLGRLVTIGTPAAATITMTLYGALRVTPTAGSHTYSLRAHVSAGTGNVFGSVAGPGANPPSFIRVVKVV